VAKALGFVVTKSLASAPAKAANQVTELVGLGSIFGKKKVDLPPPVEIHFAPGSTSIPPDAQQAINQLLERARKNEQIQLTIRSELGAADVTLAEQRANPTPEDAMALAGRFRAHKLELMSQRASLVGQVRGELASLPAAQSAESINRLRALDQQIAETENSLDQLYDLLRPGADRQAVRRTRAASIQIAQARIRSVNDMLAAGGIQNPNDRIKSAAAQFNPGETEEGGKIIITPTSKRQ
jgi:hypothetical protein